MSLRRVFNYVVPHFGARRRAAPFLEVFRSAKVINDGVAADMKVKVTHIMILGGSEKANNIGDARAVIQVFQKKQEESQKKVRKKYRLKLATMVSVAHSTWCRASHLIIHIIIKGVPCIFCVRNR